MNLIEGVSRVAKVISIAGWLAAISFAVAVLLEDGLPDNLIMLPLLGIYGVAIWSAFQVVVWIIDGFAGNKGHKSNIVWPRTILNASHARKAEITDDGK